jgi:hypothetical protein
MNMPDEIKPKAMSSPRRNDAATTSSEPVDEYEDEIYPSPLFEYLNTEKGHELVTRILNIVDDVKKVTITHNASYAKLEKWQQIAIVFAVLVASTILTIYDKFNSTIGVLFGTLVGYVFGKRK